MSTDEPYAPEPAGPAPADPALAHRMPALGSLPSVSTTASYRTAATVGRARSTVRGEPSAARTVPSCGASTSATAPRSRRVSRRTVAWWASTPSVTSRAICRVAMVDSPWLFSKLSAGDGCGLGVSWRAGAATPMPSATAVASSWSTWASCSTVRSRTGTAPTLPSSKRKASTMCCFSQPAMECQKSAACV